MRHPRHKVPAPRKTPSRPAVSLPAYWSNAAQDIVNYAVVEAADSMSVHPWSITHAAAQLKKELGSAERVREFYARALHFIAQAVPEDGASSKGLPKDRAEARLYVWLRLFAG